MRRMNRRGSIEGLPLYMTLIVIVSAASIAILSGWLSGAEFRSIGDVSVNPEEIILYAKHNPDGTITYSRDDFTIRVHVTDTDGNPIKGASITLSGMGIVERSGMHTTTPHAQTDKNGDAYLRHLSISNAYGPGEITVKVTYGHGGIKYITISVGVMN